MAHEIQIDNNGIVEITHTGRMTIVEATESRHDASAIMKERGLRLVLADVSATHHDETTTDLFDFNASHYEVFPPDSRLAVVIPSDPDQFDSAHFAESVAVNRGILMKIFLRRDEGIEWLLSHHTSSHVSK